MPQFTAIQSYGGGFKFINMKDSAHLKKLGFKQGFPFVNHFSFNKDGVLITVNTCYVFNFRRDYLEDGIGHTCQFCYKVWRYDFNTNENKTLLFKNFNNVLTCITAQKPFR